MVNGLDLFREHFRAYADRYVLIGGTACDLAMPTGIRNVTAAKEIWTELEKEDVTVVDFQDDDRLKELAVIRPSNP